MRTLLATLILALCPVSCKKNSSGRQTLIIVPEGIMHNLGDEAYTDLQTKEAESTNQNLVSRIEQIGQNIAAASGRNFDWEFKLFENKAVNAFCLPGGKVGVYSGILPIGLNDDGLAAILGHEIAHAVLRHGAERMSHGVALNFGMAVLSEGLDTNPYKNEILAALGLGAQFGINLPFSRSHELEADALGMQYMALAGYDPRAAVTIWQRMAGDSNRPPIFMSTHPDPADRSDQLAKLLPANLKLFEQADRQPSSNF